MTSSFTGIETLSRSLYNQTLVQNTIANNLSKVYRDSAGYVMVSREEARFTDLSPLSIYTGSGFSAIGQGQSLQQITRMRSFYLDYQIQQQSMTLGKQEIASQSLQQVANILDSSSGTLSDQLSTLAADFTSLSADPTNITLRNAVVADGTAFADSARNQYAQLETIQYTLNQQVSDVVSQINSYLQQLNSVNQQLMANSNGQNNSLLDARDYTLDKLARLINYNVSYGTSGTVSVSMNGLSLVDGSGAAVLGTSSINAHNPSFSDVSYQSSQGTRLDITTQIRGGQLAGLLEARDTTVEAFKDDLDHFVTSVITAANLLHRSGYGSDGVTTGINFFTGTSARDVQVNSSITTDSNRVLVAASSRYGDTTNGQIAEFLGNLPNLLADESIQSSQAMNNVFGKIDPTVAMNSAANTALNGNATSSNSTNFSTVPVSGVFTVNSSSNLAYNTSGSIYDLLDAINNADPNVEAVFSYTDQKIYILSNNSVNINQVSGNIYASAFLRNKVTSTLRMNNGLTEQDAKINAGASLNSAWNTQAFKVTPSNGGSFQVNVYTATSTLTFTFDWTNTQTLTDVATTVTNTIRAAGRTNFSFTFNASTQTMTLQDTSPVSITDLTGNFTTFTGMNGSPRIGNMGAGLSAQATDDYQSALSLTNASQASLDQLNNSQANIAAVSYSGTSGSTTVTESGVPYANEEAASVKSMIAYNAALQAMAIMDKMLADLISIVGGSTSGTSISLNQNS